VTDEHPYPSEPKPTAPSRPSRAPNEDHRSDAHSRTRLNYHPGGYLRASAALPPLPYAGAPVRAGRCARPPSAANSEDADNSRVHNDPDVTHDDLAVAPRCPR
jgi:hypothetical protein